MDISVLVWLGEHRTDALTKIMSVLTHAGSEIAAIAVICLVYWCMSRRTGTRMLLTMLSGLMLNQLLKILFVAHRPWVRSSDVKPVESALDDATGYSFPSGHTANAAAAYGGLAHGKKAKPWLKALAWALVLLVGFSRMYLGVHTPQDVLVSLVLGIALIWLMDKLSAKLEEKPNLYIPVSLSILAAGALTLAVTLLRSYPAG
ncbi:MAG: phosphatase PAP2 family protein, partial [Clostridia bacterium]|nr:phosphatase PAP2 family protein [Clostridia bacterium]